ncbi:MAG: hypothetical protein AAF697_03625 [Pseudomonadota bacterium]
MSLTACAAPQRGPSNSVIERVLTGAPGAAQPSTIVATEIAFARTAKEQGYLAAGLEYAAPGAVQHGRNGPVPFVALASALDGLDISTQWGPRLVVKSCDGSLALSQGRFVDAQGLVGNYVTTWVQQSDGSYKWSYDVSGYDDPQPPPRPEFEDGDIVVTAIDLVDGLIATCPPAGQSIPAPPPIPVGEEGKADAQLSRDGTLRWRWEHRDDGTKYVAADYFYLGQWITAIEESLPSPQ